MTAIDRRATVGASNKDVPAIRYLCKGDIIRV